jgi:parvulin-like peptidyl-prolyl isomerase
VEVEMHMKKHIVTVLIGICLLQIYCNKQEVFRLKEGTPAYQLAQNLSKIIPELDPTKDQLVATTKYFDLSAAEVINALQDNFGKRTDQLSSLGEIELKNIIRDNARGLVEKKLLIRAAEQDGITVSQSEQDSLIKQQCDRYGGEERYKQLLQQSNIDLEFVKRDLRNSLLIQHYFNNKIFKDIQISEQDIQQAYQDNSMLDKYATVRHILLMTQGKTENEKMSLRKKLEDIRKRAVQGEDFAKLAKQFTEDPGSKANGGLYQNFERGDMVKEFDEASFTLPIGEISDIIETRYGYHILKVIDRKKEAGNIDEMKPQILKQLKTQKQEAALQQKLENLKTQAGYKPVDF